jgi:hypothetical protein
MTIEEFDRAYASKPSRTSGKADSFPVRAGNWVTSKGGDLTLEDPLLINPSVRDPESHLEWVFDWNHQQYLLWEDEALRASLRPRSNDGAEDEYGKASISVYGLNRAGLFRTRLLWVRFLQTASLELVASLRELKKTPNNKDVHQKAQRQKNTLLSFTKPTMPYSGMARAYVTLFEAELIRTDPE